MGVVDDVRVWKRRVVSGGVTYYGVNMMRIPLRSEGIRWWWWWWWWGKRLRE